MIWLLSLLVGCADPDENVHDGIAVGNPTGATMRFALAPGTEISFAPAALGVASLFLQTCDDEIVSIPVGAEIGLQGEDPIEVPAGTFCLVAFTLARPVALSGVGANGGTFAFTADIGRVLMYGEVNVPLPTDAPQRALVVELARPGWISQDLLGLQPDTHRELGANCADDPACLRMWHALADQSAVYEDDSADGLVDTPERTRGPEAEGSDRGE